MPCSSTADLPHLPVSARFKKELKKRKIPEEDYVQLREYLTGEHMDIWEGERVGCDYCWSLVTRFG